MSAPACKIKAIKNRPSMYEWPTGRTLGCLEAGVIPPIRRAVPHTRIETGICEHHKESSWCVQRPMLR